MLSPALLILHESLLKFHQVSIARSRLNMLLTFRSSCAHSVADLRLDVLEGQRGVLGGELVGGLGALGREQHVFRPLVQQFHLKLRSSSRRLSHLLAGDRVHLELRPIEGYRTSDDLCGGSATHL